MRISDWSSDVCSSDLEALLLALDSGARELDETLPMSLSRLDERFDKTMRIMADASPEAEKLEAVTDAILGRVNEAEEMIRTQATLLKEWQSSAEAHLVTNRIEVRSEEHTSELQSLMRISYAVFCLKK